MRGLTHHSDSRRIWRHTITPTESERLALSENIDIITRFEHAFRAGDEATIDELCDPGLVDHNPAPDQRPTLAGFKQMVAGYSAMFPDLEEDLQEIIASGDTVATRWVVNDGRVTDIWAQSDALGMMQQLGVIPA